MQRFRWKPGEQRDNGTLRKQPQIPREIDAAAASSEVVRDADQPSGMSEDRLLTVEASADELAPALATA